MILGHVDGRVVYHLLSFVRIRTEGCRRGMSVWQVREVEARKDPE